MVRKVLIILSAIGLLYSIGGYAKDAGMYKSNEGAYYDYRVTGYNVQPNRMGVYDRGCRTDNYYCTAQLERCMGREDVTFKTPSILNEHR